MTTFIIGIFVGVLVYHVLALYTSKKRYDGTVTLGSNEYGSTISLNIAPSDLIDKDHVRLRVVAPPSPPDAA